MFSLVKSPDEFESRYILSIKPKFSDEMDKLSFPEKEKLEILGLLTMRFARSHQQH